MIFNNRLHMYMIIISLVRPILLRLSFLQCTVIPRRNWIGVASYYHVLVCHWLSNMHLIHVIFEAAIIIEGLSRLTR